MWPFSPKRDADDLRTVLGRLDALEGREKTLRLEWADVLDRLERIAGRLAKRAHRDAPVLSPETGGDHVPPQAPPVSPAMAAVMRRRGVR